MLERILHMSTSFDGFSFAPSPHFSIYSSKLPIFQFHSFGLSWLSNFYKPDTWILVSFLTCYLSFRNYFTPWATETTLPMEGNLSIVPLVWIPCNLFSAIVCVYNVSLRLLILPFNSSFSLFRPSFSVLSWTSFSSKSETCFLVGERASCSNFRLSCSLLISVYKSCMIISYFLLILASLYFLQMLIPLSNSLIMLWALL